MVAIPFKSRKQVAWCFAAEKRGEVPKGMCEEWAKKTKNIKDLPEKVGGDKGVRGKRGGKRTGESVGGRRRR